MAVATTLDVTESFNADNAFVQDMSGWDYAVVQLVAPSGTVNFTATNDGGAVQSVTDGNSSLAINFTAVQGVNLATGAAGTSLAAAGLMKFNVVGRYLQLAGVGITATKVLIYLHKI